MDDRPAGERRRTGSGVQIVAGATFGAAGLIAVWAGISPCALLGLAVAGVAATAVALAAAVRTAPSRAEPAARAPQTGRSVLQLETEQRVD